MKTLISFNLKSDSDTELFTFRLFSQFSEVINRALLIPSLSTIIQEAINQIHLWPNKNSSADPILNHLSGGLRGGLVAFVLLVERHWKVIKFSSCSAK